MNRSQPLTTTIFLFGLLCLFGLRDTACAQLHGRAGKVGPILDLSDVPLNRPNSKLDLDDEMVYEFFPSFLGLGSPGARQIRTKYFLINFGGAENTARRVADIADDAFEQITQHYPGSVERFAPIHVFVNDGSDILGNAFAIPSNSFIMFYATPFDIEQRGSSEWVRNVFTHELAHIITLKAAHTSMPFGLGILGVSQSNSNPDYRFVLPVYNTAVPIWYVEGIAQFESKKFGGDSWDTHRDMLLRMATLENDLHTYTGMNSFSGKDGFHSEMVYNQGYALLNYMEETYGDERVRALLDHRPIVNFKSSIKKAFGISADRVYDDWVAHLEEKYGAVADSMDRVGEREGELIFDKGSYEFYPTYSPDGSKVAFITNNGEDYRLNKLVIMDLSTRRLDTVAEWNDQPFGLLSTRFSWAPDGKGLFFVRSVGGRWDLFSYDLERKEEKRVTIGLRGKDPSISPGGTEVAFVGNRGGTNSLGILRIDSTRVRHLTQNNNGTQYFGPKWSPDGKRILFTVFRGEDRDIAIIDPDATPRPKHRKRNKDKEVEDDSLAVFPDSVAYASDAGFEALVSSSADERDPVWLPDGSGFVFSSDRTGIFNLYSYDLVTGRQEQITNVIGGAFVPTVSPDGEEIIYAGFHAANYSLYRIQRSAAVPVEVAEALPRDYRGIYTGEKLSDLYSIGRYGGRITTKGFGIIPILVLGPTFIGNRFGLDQISVGAQAAWGEFFGSDVIVAGFSVGKNLRRRTDLNSDLYFYYEKGLPGLETEHKSYRPTFFTSFNKTTINSLLERGTVLSQQDTSSGTLITVIDSQQVIIPNTTQQLHLTLQQEDEFKDVFNDFTLGFEMGIGRGQMLSLAYNHRRYSENLLVRQTLLDSTRLFQRNAQGVNQDITDQVPGFVQDPRDFEDSFYHDLTYFRSNNFAVGWRYASFKPTKDMFLNPRQGRSITLRYSRINVTVTDSLALSSDLDQNQIPDPTYTDPSPSIFRSDNKKLGINEYIFSWNEFIPFPGRTTLGLQGFVGYKDKEIKDPVQNGGTLEGSFYFPLRYYLGGLGTLRGYPYFSLSGGKVVYGRATFTFPIFQRIDKELAPFAFDKLYGSIFVETGATGNSARFRDVVKEIDKDKFLTDWGFELRFQMTANYVLPVFGYFQFAKPTSDFIRDRVTSARIPVDSRRYYFGISI